MYLDLELVEPVDGSRVRSRADVVASTDVDTDRVPQDDRVVRRLVLPLRSETREEHASCVTWLIFKQGTDFKKSRISF